MTDCKSHTHTSDAPHPALRRSRKCLKIGSIKGILWQGHMRRMYLCKRESCSSAFLPLFLMWKFGKEPKQLRSGPFIFLKGSTFSVSQFREKSIVCASVCVCPFKNERSVTCFMYNTYSILNYPILFHQYMHFPTIFKFQCVIFWIICWRKCNII